MPAGRPAGRAPRTAPAGPFDRLEKAQAEYLRMRQLRSMSDGELRALLGGDPSKAAPWVETAARYGLPEAQLRLGRMILDGLGGPKDRSAAFGWFMRAAKTGSPEAMNMVGRCHENGWGAPEDPAAVADWYRRSAEAGHDWGEYNYANMLFDGRGLACDQAQAVGWYRRAADRGHARAMNLLARCYEEGWGVDRDRAQARAWYQRSAQGGYFRAQYNFATVLVAEGRIDEALAWFETACRAATPDSLGAMLAGLASHGDPRLAALGRRISEAPYAPA